MLSVQFATYACLGVGGGGGSDSITAQNISGLTDQCMGRVASSLFLHDLFVVVLLAFMSYVASDPCVISSVICPHCLSKLLHV